MPSAFIVELVRAANEVDRLTENETSRLLQRAAATIRDYRELIDDPVAPNGSDNDIVFELNSMASAVDLFPKEAISAMILEAAEIMKSYKSLLASRRQTSG